MRVSFFKAIKIECVNKKMGGGKQNKIGFIN